MIKIKDINYVAYLATVKGIDFDTYEKLTVEHGNRLITQFVYESLELEEYNRAVADFHKSDVSNFVNKLRNLKTIVHDQV